MESLLHFKCIISYNLIISDLEMEMFILLVKIWELLFTQVFCQPLRHICLNKIFCLQGLLAHGNLELNWFHSEKCITKNCNVIVTKFKYKMTHQFETKAHHIIHMHKMHVLWSSEVKLNLFIMEIGLQRLDWVEKCHNHIE